LLQDIRFGLRTALKNKGVTGMAIACLAIGIGLNTMIFSVTDAVLIHPLPFPDLNRLVVIHSTQPKNGIRREGLSWLDLLDWKERAKSFSAMAAVQFRQVTVGDGSGDTDRYAGAAVSANMFSLIGASPQIGRTFTDADDRQGGEPVVVISDALWIRRYSRDPNILGRVVQINTKPHTVIGVMAPRFQFPENQYLWLPLAQNAVSQQRAARNMTVFAKIRETVTYDQARQEADAIAADLAKTFPDSNDGWGAYLERIYDWAIPSDVTLIVLTMMGSVTMVLLIACFNVANLMLARAAARSREMAIRTALGAGRRRILRQLLTESVFVALCSVPLGLLCAKGGLTLMDMSIPQGEIPYFLQWAINGRAFAYSIAVAALTGIVFGLAPAIQASRADLQEAMKDGGRGSAGSTRVWLRNGLVVGEVALSLVLLIGASLFVRSFVNLRQATIGFDTTPLLTLRFFMPPERYATPDSKQRRVEDVLRRVEALPGVQAAFASNMVPLDGGGGATRIVIAGHPVEKGKEPQIGFIGVSAHMLRTLGLQVARGRELADTESLTKAPFAVINQTMAKRFWPTDDALGRTFQTMTLNPADSVTFTVVGIAPDIRQRETDETDPISPTAYVAYPFGITPNTGLTIRATGDPLTIATPVRAALRDADSSIAVFQMQSMDELRRRGYWEYFLFGWMFSLFGGIALLLAAIGVYGVLSYAVEQRTQEIGVRVALGASRGNVLSLVVSHGVRLAAVGVVVGLIASYFVMPVIESQLVKVSPTDPLSFIGVSIFLTAIAIVASYVPARRATAVDPLVALRAE
jgi:putative ABC transport system permease protein